MVQNCYVKYGYCGPYVDHNVSAVGKISAPLRENFTPPHAASKTMNKTNVAKIFNGAGGKK